MKKIFLLVAILFSALLTVQAQNIDEPGGDVDEVPVDGGLSLLVAAGAAYGVRTMRKGKRSNKFK